MSNLRKTIKSFQMSEIPYKNEKMLSALRKTKEFVHQQIEALDLDEDVDYEDVLEQEFGTAEVAARPQLRNIVFKSQRYFQRLLENYL